MVMVLGTCVFVMPPDVEGQILPEIDVVTGPPVVLDVSPSGTGLGQNTVIISNSAYDASVRVKVTITAPGYYVSPEQVTITIPPNSEKTIYVAVAAMQRTPYKQGNAQVHAEVTHANGCPFSGVDADGGFMILSKPYGKVILQSEKPFQKVGPGKDYPFQVKVLNNGNSMDTFVIEVLNKEKLNERGFSISLSSTTTKNIERSSYDVVTVLIQTPREFGWKNEYTMLEIKATSEVEKQTSEYSIVVWVYGFGVSGFEPIYSILAIVCVAAFVVKRTRNNS